VEAKSGKAIDQQTGISCIIVDNQYSDWDSLGAHSLNHRQSAD
jgi:hypothetical protein